MIACIIVSAPAAILEVDLSRATPLSVKPALESESWDFDIECAALPGL